MCMQKINKQTNRNTAHTYHSNTSAADRPCRICWESCRPWRRAVERWHTWGWIWGKSQPHELWRSSLARSYGRRRRCPKNKRVDVNGFSAESIWMRRLDEVTALDLLRGSWETHELPRCTATAQCLRDVSTECHFISNWMPMIISIMMDKCSNKYMSQYIVK